MGKANGRRGKRIQVRGSRKEGETEDEFLLRKRGSHSEPSNIDL